MTYACCGECTCRRPDDDVVTAYNYTSGVVTVNDERSYLHCKLAPEYEAELIKRIAQAVTDAINGKET